MRPIIDSHLDLAWNALSFNRDLTLEVAELREREQGMTDEKSRGHCTTSLPELRRANVPICVATLLARGGPAPPFRKTILRTDLDYASQSIAFAAAQGQLAYYKLLEAQGHLHFIRTAAELDAHWKRCRHNGDGDVKSDAVATDTGRRGEDRDPTATLRPPAPLGIILSMEGADPVVEPSQLGEWWDAGLRAIEPVHYGHSHYAAGTGVTGPLTDRGVELLREMRRLGFILDVTHFCDEGFWQAMDEWDGPVLASHHNCRALVPGDRQLADEQINTLIDRGAVIGAAFDAWMLYPGWKHGETSPEVVGLDAVADHIDHVCQLAGNANHSAIGTDLDGGFGTEQTPRDLDTFADVQKLDAILQSRGYSDADIDAIFHGNWLRFFGEALP